MERLVTDAFKKGELKGTREGELKGIEKTHETSFLLGYQVGLDYMEVPQDDHRREPPVVPPVQLPRHLLPIEQPNSTVNAPSKQPNPVANAVATDA